MVLAFGRIWEFFLTKSLIGINFVLEFTESVVRYAFNKQQLTLYKGNIIEEFFFMVDKDTPYVFKKFKFLPGTEYDLQFALETDESIEMTSSSKKVIIEDNTEWRYYHFKFNEDLNDFEESSENGVHHSLNEDIQRASSSLNIINFNPDYFDDFTFTLENGTIVVNCDKWYIGKVQVRKYKPVY